MDKIRLLSQYRMIFRSEIKDFIKNTFFFTLFFALTLHLSWVYIFPYVMKNWASAGNEARFVKVETPFLWAAGTAYSLAIGQKDSLIQSWQSVPEDTTFISIVELTRDPKHTQEKLIHGHMQMISSYARVLSLDLANLLDSSSDRKTTLDNHIRLLKNYGNATNERLKILAEQIADLKAIVTQNTTESNTAKWILQHSLDTMQYDGVDKAIDTYTTAKSDDLSAKIYLVYLERFTEIYKKMQTKNRTILETLTNNREALIQKSTIVIPKSWTNLLHELGVIQTEAEHKSQNTTILQ
jgi:flagellar motility protein MotE (MotC chaperone)